MINSHVIWFAVSVPFVCAFLKLIKVYSKARPVSRKKSCEIPMGLIQELNLYLRIRIPLSFPLDEFRAVRILSDNISMHTPPWKSSSAHTKSNAFFRLAFTLYVCTFSSKNHFYCHNPPENAQKWPKTVVRPTQDSSSMHSTGVYQWSVYK